MLSAILRNGFALLLAVIAVTVGLVFAIAGEPLALLGVALGGLALLAVGRNVLVGVGRAISGR